MTASFGRTGGDRSLNGDHTEPDGMPDRPDGRSEAFNRHWAFVLPNLPERALRKIDQVQLSLLCELLAEIDDLGKAIDLNPADLKSRSLRLRVAQHVHRLSATFGLSPADRQRLRIEPEAADDPFQIWLAEAESG